MISLPPENFYHRGHRKEIREKDLRPRSYGLETALLSIPKNLSTSRVAAQCL
jgi:hypothetical protein